MNEKELKLRFPSDHIISDDIGGVSVMVYVEKFFLDEVIKDASHIPHPAFIVGGKEIDGIYISKFQNITENGRAYSLPNVDPRVNIDFDEAVEACRAKGEGFHIMSAAEWGAIALLCQKNGWLPFGNNEMGKDVREQDTVARISYYDAERSICRTATGTGPVEWSHNRREDGIYDLNANVWEWNGGFRLVFGELQILENVRTPDKGLQNAESSAWRAIDGTSGELLIPDGRGTTKNSVKLDFIDGKWTYVSGDITNSDTHFRYCELDRVSAHPSICKKAKELLCSLAILPCSCEYSYPEVALYANNGKADRIAFRGGRFGQGLNAGLFKTCLDDPRTYSGEAVGFRCAYYKT